jgi:plastocyanin
MTRWLLLLMAAALFALVAACGDDDDDDGGGDELTEEEYFTTMDEIDKELDVLFEDESAETAGEAAEQFEGAVDTALERYGGVTPPADLQDEHDTLIEAIGSFGEAITAAAEDLDTEAEVDAYFETVFSDEAVGAADEEVTAAFCAIQDAADAAGVEADVGCDSGDSVDPASVPAEETTEVDLAEFAFNPPHIQVSVGDTVTWTNSDEAPHDATLDDESQATDTLNSGDTGELTFDEAGEFPYHCSIHPEMLGLVTVVE